MIRIIKDPTHWAAGVLGLIVALIVATTFGSWDDIGWRVYDSWRPPATIEATRLEGPIGEVRARLKVTRHRGECVFSGPAAFEEFPDGTGVRVFGARVDGQPTVNVPGNRTLIAEWRFWPVSVGKLRIIMEYRCDGRAIAVPVKWM